MHRTPLVALVIVLVLAGCSGGSTVSPTPQPTEQATTAATTDQQPRQSSPSANPWSEQTVTVAVRDAPPWRNVSTLVANALDYWEANDERYAPYQVDYALDPDADRPDIVVRFVDDISTCGTGSYDSAVGWAPAITNQSDLDRPAEVCIRTGYTDETTQTVVKHEFGHLLGLEHGDQPLPLMSVRHPRLRLPRPSAGLRAFTWPRSTIRVYADFEGIYARREHIAREQVNNTLAYYERGAGDTLTREVSFVRVDDRAAADVVLTFTEKSPCAEPGWGTCGWLEPRANATSQFHVTVTNLHEDAVGWHVGYWLGYTFEPERKADLPPPLRTSTYESRRSRWWNESDTP